eukprot:jgi/Chlat1/4848/Chrsp31S04880
MTGATTGANMLFLLTLLCAATSTVTAQDSTWVLGRECAKSLLFQESRGQTNTGYTQTRIKSIPAQDAVQGPGAPQPVTLYTAVNTQQKVIYHNTGNTADRFQDKWHILAGNVSTGGVTPATAGSLSPAMVFTYSRWNYPENAGFAIDNSAAREGFKGKRFAFVTGDVDAISAVANWFPDKVKVLEESGDVRVDTTGTLPSIRNFIRRARVYGNRTRLGGVQTFFRNFRSTFEPIEQMQLDTVNRRVYTLHINYNRQRSYLAVHDISTSPPTLTFIRPIDHDYVKYFKIDVYSSPPVLYALILGVELYKTHLVALDGSDTGGSSDTVVVGPKVFIAGGDLSYYSLYSNFDIYYDPECVAALELAPAPSK